MRRHFLYLTNSRLVSVAARGRRIVARRDFPVSGAGAAEFERFMAGLASVPTHVFTDLAEEDFRLDTIPHLGPRDRGAVLARKLAQVFRNTPYRHAILQGREPDGRRDDRVVYTAVSNAEVLRPWIEIFERLKVPVAGIHSAAVFSARLLEALGLAFPHALLVTFTPGEAMRQTYFREGEIKFSRLTPIDLQEGQSLGAMVAEETTRTWQYLDSLRNFQAGDRLEVCVLLHESDRGKVQPELRDFAQIQYQVLEMGKVAQALRLAPAPQGSSAEEVLVHLFLARAGDNHFASEELRRFATLRRAGQGLRRAAAVAMLAAIAWGGWNLWRAFKADETDLRVANQVTALSREYEEITRSLPSFGVGGSTMRDAVAFYNSAIRSHPTIGQFLEPVSQVLDGHPRVRLSQLAWRVTDDERAPVTLPGGTTPFAPPVRAVPKGPEAPAAPGGRAALEDAQNPPFAGGRFEVALVEATLGVPSNDFRGALDEVGRLVEDIGRLPGYRAEIVESPLEVRSSYALQGRHGEREPAVMETRFVLRIVREKAAT